MRGQASGLVPLMPRDPGPESSYAAVVTSSYADAVTDPDAPAALMPRPPAEVLLFDVMDTLVHDPFFEVMPAFFGLSFRELLAEKHPRAWVEFEKGERGEVSFLNDFFADGRAYDQRGFVECIRGSYRFISGMEALLADLRRQAVPMHALSNYPAWYEMIEERLALSRFLSWTFVSCRTGVRKPDEAAFLGAARALDLPPDRLLFIDDRAQNCAAARAVGLDAVVFTDAADLRRALVERGLLPG